MFRGLNFPPVLLTQPLELEDREGLCRLKRLAEKLRDLLRDRATFPFSAGLKFFVKRVRQVFDIQDRHVITPHLLHYGGRRWGSQLLVCPRGPASVKTTIEASIHAARAS